MDTLQRLHTWTDSNRDLAFDLLRIYLGIGLFVRGVIFISDPEQYLALLTPAADAWLTSVFIVHYVALAHLAGGLMLALGLLTRIAALIQIPILAGAVFLVHFQGGLLAESQSFEFSALVLFLLVLYLLYGAGRLSADYYLFDQEPETEPVVQTRHETSQPVYDAPARQDRPARRVVQSGQKARVMRRQWKASEVIGVFFFGAFGLLLLLTLVVPISFSAAELLLVLLAIVALSLTFVSFYKKWSHSTRWDDEPAPPRSTADGEDRQPPSRPKPEVGVSG